MLIRGHHTFDGQFTQVPNTWLRDRRISLGAKGLIAQLLSHRPGWSITLQTLATQNGCGKDKIRTLIRELEGAGYLHRSDHQRHDERGYLAGYDYTTADPPSWDYPTKVEPTKVEPTKEKPTLKKTIEKKTIVKKTIDKEFTHFWSLYPKKRDKGNAHRAFEKALEKTDFETIMKGLAAYVTDPTRDDQFTAYPATWLNGERWADEYEKPKQTPGPGKRAWVKEMHDLGEHWACEPGEFPEGCN